MKSSVLSVSLIMFALLAAMNHPASAQLTAEKSEEGVVVRIDGKPFTEYLTEVSGKPILWPIIGPTGKPMTRAYPMIEDIEGERHDHPHQASFWFTHGEINGSNFWAIRASNDILGTTRHREFRRIESGKTATIVSVNDWIGHDGTKVMEDERVIEFGTIGDSRYIDFTITLKATEGPVTFADTKEGTFGVRVAATMAVDSKLGGKIVNSKGQIDRDAWGRPAAWVDYHGPVDNETVGIAILNHPSSFRFPTYWHVRGYGLFAANPFGLSDFPDTAKSGEYTLEKGKEITLRYRVIFHRGTETDADIASLFDAYAKKQ